MLKGVARIDERSIPGPAGDIPVRVYWPENPTGATVVFFHGGGWIIGDLDSHDGHARRLAATVGAVVVHVEYRLAPENPFPAGYEDCLAATEWAYDHIDELGGRIDRIASPVTAPAATSPPASHCTAATPGDRSPVNS